MKRCRLRSTIVVLLLVLPGMGPGYGAEPAIRLNSLGYLPGLPKKASVAAECSDFSVKRVSDGKVIYEAAAAGPVAQNDVNQQVWTLDFSGLKQPGTYYLDVPGVGRSYEFEVREGAYDFAYRTAMRAFYLWRCGTAVEGQHQGQQYSHGPCHLNDGYEDYLGREGSRRDGVGGWHDAGDYGKYTVNAGATAGVLFLAWDHFGDRIKDIDLDLPQTAVGWPDFLREIKWETDWLLKMPYPDGSGNVSHKLTRLNFSGFIMPEQDDERRFFTAGSSAAVADFVAVMAMAARYFEPYDAAYAKQCLDAAERSYAWLKANPADQRFNQGPFRTGGYQTSDPDDRLWAAAEMWQTTGNTDYLKDFETAVAAPPPSGRRGGRPGGGPGRMVDESWDWGNLRNIGMFTYILSSRGGRDPNLVERIRSDTIDVADGIVRSIRSDVYGRPLNGVYCWGCNGTVARMVVNVHVANRLAPKPEYVEATVEILSHLFGRNFYGRSYVTGLGRQPPMRPHDRRSGADRIDAPWPGYVIGGGHSATGWKDEQEDYRTNEIAINWQAALVYALAALAGDAE